MNANKELIERTIELRKKFNDDPVKEFATRNKDSPINEWNKFQKFTKKEFKKIYTSEIDGVKLKFRYTTLIINGRHKSE